MRSRVTHKSYHLRDHVAQFKVEAEGFRFTVRRTRDPHNHASVVIFQVETDGDRHGDAGDHWWIDGDARRGLCADAIRIVRTKEAV